MKAWKRTDGVWSLVDANFNESRWVMARVENYFPHELSPDGPPSDEDYQIWCDTIPGRSEVRGRRICSEVNDWEHFCCAIVADLVEGLSDGSMRMPKPGGDRFAENYDDCSRRSDNARRAWNMEISPGLRSGYWSECLVDHAGTKKRSNY